MASRLLRPRLLHFVQQCGLEDLRPLCCAAANVWSHGGCGGFGEKDVSVRGGRSLNPRGSTAICPWNLEDGRSSLKFSGSRARFFTSTRLGQIASGAGGDDTEESTFTEGESIKNALDSVDNSSTPEEQSENSNDNLEDVVSAHPAMQPEVGKVEGETLDENGASDDLRENSKLVLDGANHHKDEDEHNEEDADEEDFFDDGNDEDYDEESDMEAESEGSGSLLAHLQAVPKRQRQFLLQKALKIPTKKHRVKVVKRKALALREFLMRQMRVVDVNRTCKVTKGGGVLNFTAFVVCGNCDGVAAFGKGKGQEVGEAVAKAQLRAIRNLHYFDIYNGHTIYHEIEAKYGKTKIRLWPAHSGVGMRASPVVKDILQLAGYKDVKSKVIGSRHPHNTVKAVFKALSMIESPEELSQRVGSTVVESRFVQ